MIFISVLIRVNSGLQSIVNYNPRRTYCPLEPKQNTFNATKGSPKIETGKQKKNPMGIQNWIKLYHSVYPVLLQQCGGKDIEDNLRIGGIIQITICLHLQPIKVRFYIGSTYKWSHWVNSSALLSLINF